MNLGRYRKTVVDHNIFGREKMCYDGIKDITIIDMRQRKLSEHTKHEISHIFLSGGMCGKKCGHV